MGSNYSLTFVEGVFTMTARDIAVTANDNGKTYGEADPALTHQITSGSLVGSDAFSGAIARQVGESVGTYDIQQGTLVLNGNYNLTFMDGTFTIDPKALTITAYSRSKLYGDTVTFYGTEFVVIGLDAGDSVTRVTLISTGAPGPIEVGDYPIVPSAAVGTGLTKYAITYVNGTLKVQTKALTIAANSRSKIYGEMVIFGGTEFTSNGLLNGDTVTRVTLTSVGTDGANAVGTYDIVASNAVGTGLDNYVVSYINGSLRVNKASVGLSLSSSVGTSTEGNTITFTAIVTGTGATGTLTFEEEETILGSVVLNDGTATYTLSTLPIGSHSITAVYSGDANFTGSMSSAVNLTVKTAAGLSWALIGGCLLYTSPSPRD